MVGARPSSPCLYTTLSSSPPPHPTRQHIVLSDPFYPILIFIRDRLLPPPPPRASGAHQLNGWLSAGSNSSIRKPELIQELARAAVSGVEEHGVTAHYRSMRKGQSLEKILRTWPHPK